ncbi:thiamine-phosphate kinase [Verticiella sediminum]|uniref:thiamine-phosphate kinase n=1 Tax=Verticiella sediminum TaxID=1247510 RepID=UPI001FEA2A49|nr:thiamine-phosphate kinase [Verticiella sediminum]
MSEFDLIRRHFTRPAPAGILGVGDDCALLPAMPGAWAVSTDLLLQGRHFFADVDPRALGHKALAVNLSDLAAMGAEPAGFVLGLGLPAVDEAWLAGFADGLHRLAERWRCPLVGGDTTRSDTGITLSVTVFGRVDARRALRRDAARDGDDIWVSGTLGEADVALRLLLRARGQGLERSDELGRALAGLDPQAASRLLEQTRPRLDWPQPRIALGLALAGVAHAAIDLSDGLLQDLGHVVAASHCGALLDAPALPLAKPLAALGERPAWQAALGGGDVYELCFTAPVAARARIAAMAGRLDLPLTRIGRMDAAVDGIGVRGSQGELLDAATLPQGFDHFR